MSAEKVGAERGFYFYNHNRVVSTEQYRAEGFVEFYYLFISAFSFIPK